ncbi:MAG: twin-arginine translocation signal domain-containing protein, partial [Pirellula sp.]
MPKKPLAPKQLPPEILPPKSLSQKSRRTFLKETAFGGAILGLSPQTHRALFAAEPPSERIRVGMIGVGNQGGPKNNMKYFLKNIVALCDLDKSYLAEASSFLQKEAGLSAVTTDDYRRLLDAKDVD